MSHVRLRNTKIYTVWLYLSLTKHQPGLSHTPEQPPQLSHLHMRQAQFPVGRASVDLSYVGGGGGGIPSSIGSMIKTMQLGMASWLLS